MIRNQPVDADRIHLKIIYWGMALNLLIPMILVALGLFLKSKGVGQVPVGNLKYLFVILLGVSLSEAGVIYILKKNSSLQRMSSLGVSPEQVVLRNSMIIFSIALAPSIYGFIYLFLGGTMEWFLLFVAFTLLYFMLFKPKIEDIKNLVDKLDVQSNQESGAHLQGKSF